MNTTTNISKAGANVYSPIPYDMEILQKQSKQKTREQREFKQFGSCLISESEHRVLKLLSLGKSQKEIAHELCISRLTVSVHLSKIYRAIGVNNATEAVRWYIFTEYGLIDFEAKNKFLKKVLI